MSSRPEDGAQDAPLVTFVVAAYNAGATLGAALDSILQQRGASFEVIVVDDGSADDTLAVAERYAAAYPQVRVITQANSGTAVACNRAFAHARGEFLARLDADDEFADGYLSEMIAFTQANPDYELYSPDLYAAPGDGTRYRLYGWPDERSYSLADMLEKSVIPGAGTMFRRRVLDGTGGYREHIYNEDYDLWLRALAGGMRHRYLPRPLYVYHLAADTRKSAALVTTYTSTIQIQRDLIASGHLTDEQVQTVEHSIAYIQTLIEQAERDDGGLREQVVTDSMSSVRRTLSRLVGQARAERLIVWAFRFSPLIRPFWRAWLWLAVRARRLLSGKPTGDGPVSRKGLS